MAMMGAAAHAITPEAAKMVAIDATTAENHFMPASPTVFVTTA
jgi:hypothetical protein